MSEENPPQLETPAPPPPPLASSPPPARFDVDAKWEACVDLGARRFVYSSLAGAFGGLLLFRSPVTRWAAVAFGAGIGIGSAYTECSYKFNESSAKPAIPEFAAASSTQGLQKED